MSIRPTMSMCLDKDDLIRLLYEHIDKAEEYNKEQEQIIQGMHRQNTKLHTHNMELQDMCSVIYDRYTVYQYLSDNATRRTSSDNVSDVLDAIDRVWKGGVC